MGAIPVVGLILIPQLILGYPLVASNIAFLSLLAVPVGYGFAIFRYKLIGVKETVNRGMALLLVGLSLPDFIHFGIRFHRSYFSNDKPIAGVGLAHHGRPGRLDGEVVPLLNAFVNNVLTVDGMTIAL